MRRPTCGHITQSVQHVVVDCMIDTYVYKDHDGFAGLRRPDAATAWVLAGRPRH